MADRGGTQADRFTRGDWALKILPCEFAKDGGWLGRKDSTAMVYEAEEINAHTLSDLVWFESEEDAKNFLIGRVMAADDWHKVSAFLVPTLVDKTKYGPIIKT